jgi:hypothetical protein
MILFSFFFKEANGVLAHPPPTVKKKQQSFLILLSFSSSRSSHHKPIANLSRSHSWSFRVHGAATSLSAMERSCQAAARATSRLSRLTHAALLVLVGGSSRVEFVAAQLQFMSLLVFLSFFPLSLFTKVKSTLQRAWLTHEHYRKVFQEV